MTEPFPEFQDFSSSDSQGNVSVNPQVEQQQHGAVTLPDGANHPPGLTQPQILPQLATIHLGGVLNQAPSLPHLQNQSGALLIPTGGLTSRRDRPGLPVTPLPSQTAAPYSVPARPGAAPAPNPQNEFGHPIDWPTRTPDPESDGEPSPFTDSSVPGSTKNPKPSRSPRDPKYAPEHELSHMARANNDLDWMPDDLDREFPPFLDPAAHQKPYTWGVVKIENIPYSVTVQEINHFIVRLCRGSLLAPHLEGYPIHIIIERPTGKTQEAFVEFRTVQDAQICILHVENARARGESVKIGQRHVALSMSSQGELAAVLFPRAKFISWDPATGAPSVIPITDPKSEGFRGFFTIEEFASLVKHAETPQRSPFSVRCMQRTYESMISALYKFPWRHSGLYTLAARDYLFSTYVAQLRVLVSKVIPVKIVVPGQESHARASVERMEREVGLNHQLLMDFVFSGLNVSCFSLRQKFEITANSGDIGINVPLTPYAFAWPFQCLVPPSGTPGPAIKFWLKLMAWGCDVSYEHGLLTGFERYLRMERDGFGNLIVQFTAAGVLLQFNQAVTLEYNVMEQMINRGRMKLCEVNGWQYHPFDLSRTANNVPEVDGLARQFDRIVLIERAAEGRVLTHGQMLGQEVAQPSLPQSHVPGANPASTTPRAFARQYEIVNEQLGRLNRSGRNSDRAAPAADHATHATKPAARLSTDFNIDPRTPEFIPSRPWNSSTGLGRQNGFHTTASGQNLASAVSYNFSASRPVTPPPRARSGSDESSNNDDHVDAGRGRSGNYSTPSISRQSPAQVSSTEFYDGATRLLRRKTINVEATIDEEGEAGHGDGQGGAPLKSHSCNWACSPKHDV